MDRNDDGTLEDSEVQSTQVVCNGTSFTFPTVTLAPGSAACAVGGTSMEIGFDNNGNGTLDDAEVTAREAVCSTAAVLVQATTLPQGSEACIGGGLTIRLGSDDGGEDAVPADGILQAAEVESSRDVCLPVIATFWWGDRSREPPKQSPTTRRAMARGESAPTGVAERVLSAANAEDRRACTRVEKPGVLDAQNRATWLEAPHPLMDVKPPPRKTNTSTCAGR